MNILGIESATTVCAAAIVEDGRILSEKTIDLPRVHSEKMISLIGQTLSDASSSPRDIDGIAVSIGPGSFTGLRIGLSIAKGLAFGNDKPLIAVSTLEALAWNAVRGQSAHKGHLLLPLIDARRDEVYAASYRPNGTGLEVGFAPCSMTLKDLQVCLRNDSQVLLSGDGAEKFLQYIFHNHHADAWRYSILSRDRLQCSAAAVGILGEKKLVNGEAADLPSLEPVYVKDFSTLVKSQHARM